MRTFLFLPQSWLPKETGVNMRVKVRGRDSLGIRILTRLEINTEEEGNEENLDGLWMIRFDIALSRGSPVRRCA